MRVHLAQMGRCALPACDRATCAGRPSNFFLPKQGRRPYARRKPIPGTGEERPGGLDSDMGKKQPHRLHT